MGFFTSNKKRKLKKTYNPQMDNTPYGMKSSDITDSVVKRMMTFVTDQLLKSKSVESNEEAVARKSALELESNVLTNPVLLSGIQLYQVCCQELLTPEKFLFKDVKVKQDFAENVYPSHKTHFQHTCLKMNPMHSAVFGESLTEIVKGRKSKKPQDFLNMDSRQYDFITDSSGYSSREVKTNKYNLPLGFWDVDDHEIEFKDGKDMVWAPFIQIHNLERGWGFAELLYTTTNQLDAIIDARTQRAYRQGYPTPMVEYGNEKFPANNRRKGEAKKIAEMVVDPRYVAVWYPNYIKVNFMDDKASSSSSSKNIMDDEMLIRRTESATLGIPVSVYLMTTAGESGSTGVKDLTEFFELKLKSFVRSLKIETILSLYYDNPDLDVTIDYDNILSNTSKEKVMQIFRFAKSGMLYGENKAENDKIRKQVLRMVGIETEDDFMQMVRDENEKSKEVEE